MKTNQPASSSGKPTPRASLETVGNHNAVVYHSGNGSKIILLEDASGASAQHRLAYREMAKLISERDALVEIARAALEVVIQDHGSLDAGVDWLNKHGDEACGANGALVAKLFAAKGKVAL